jgi:hypothetical protein
MPSDTARLLLLLSDELVRMHEWNSWRQAVGSGQQEDFPGCHLPAACWLLFLRCGFVDFLTLQTASVTVRRSTRVGV